MKEQIIKLINNSELSEVMFNLYERWQNKKEYEDIAEYAQIIMKNIEKTTAMKFNLVKGTKRPFGIIIENDDKKVKNDHK